MYVELSFGDLNLDSYLSHHTNTYTCEVIIASKVRGGIERNFEIMSYSLEL